MQHILSKSCLATRAALHLPFACVHGMTADIVPQLALLASRASDKSTHLQVCWEERSTHRAVHEDEVLVAGEIEALCLDAPAKSAPVVALIGVVRVPRI